MFVCSPPCSALFWCSRPSLADGQNELARRGNTSWCNCEHCENWESQQERECVCCQEIDEAMTKISGEILLVKKDNKCHETSRSLF